MAVTYIFNASFEDTGAGVTAGNTLVQFEILNVMGESYILTVL